MNHSVSSEDTAEKLIIRGVHLTITDALHAVVTGKATRLLRRNDQIVRVRIDLEFDRTQGVGKQFIAKGRIEIGGPDLMASVATEDAYASLDLLIDKLDRLLRQRHGLWKDHRNHPHPVERAEAFRKTAAPASQ
jgi:putative sigma-54 modulation protein